MKQILFLFVLLWGSLAPAAIDDQRVPDAKVEEPPKQPVLTKAPELVTFVNADYPADLLAQGVGGEVLMFIDIDAKGRVERVEVQKATTPEFAQAAMNAVTQFVFSPAEVDYAPSAIRIEYNYVFTPELPQPDAIAGQAQPQSSDVKPEEPVSFTGLVREAGTRAKIAGAAILINDVPWGTTDDNGRFELRGVPTGKIAVKVAAPAYQAYTVEEERGETERLEVKYYLVRVAPNPFETVVRTKADKREVAKVELDRKEVSKIPGTFGDPIRVVENLPGVARTPGGLGGALIVRGARPEDSAVFIDGVDVPLIFHFGGLTSVVNANFLERIDFMPGGFGARYGRATAGVVDIVSRDLNCDILHGSAQVDLIDSEAYACTPAWEWSAAAAARRSYIDLLLPYALDFVGQDGITASPRYWDYQAKAGISWDNQRFDIFAFGSNDRLRFLLSGSAEDVDVNAGIHLAFHRVQFRHRIKWGENTSLNSQVTPGYALQEFEQSSAALDFETTFKVPITSVAWREDFSHKANDWLTVNLGLDNIFGWADLGLEAPIPTDLRRFPTNVFDFTVTGSYEQRLNNYSQAYWAEAVLQPLPTLKLVPGIRFERFDFYKTQGFSAMPRFTARYEITKGSTVKGAWGIYDKLPEPQYLLDSIGNPNLVAERSQQFIVGFEQTITDAINVDLQLYYNKRTRLRSPSDKTTFVNGRAVDEIWNNDGKGRTYGLELLLRHLSTNDGKFFGWVSYTLSRSVQEDRRDQQRGEAETGTQLDSEEDPLVEYLVPWDQTHILTVVGQWTLPYGFEAGVRFRLISGNPFTPADRGQVTFDADSGEFSTSLRSVERNSERLPMFHALDWRVDKTWTFDLWKFGVYLEILNTYNHKNVEAVQYDYRYRNRVYVALLPIIPNIGVKGEF